MKNIAQTKNIAGFFATFFLLLAAGFPGTMVLAQPPPPPPPPPPGGGGGPAGAPCGSTYFQVCNDINGPSCIDSNQCGSCNDTSGNPACDAITYTDSACTPGNECTVGGGGGLPVGSSCSQDSNCASFVCNTNSAGGCTCASGTGPGSCGTGGGGTSCNNNGTVDGTEDCDGTDLNNETCLTLSFTGGTLSCNSNCTFNTSACTGGTGGGGNGGTLPTIPEPKVTSINDFYVALKAVAQWLLVFGIILGVIFIILGAISILTSKGESGKLETGKKTITWAVVGVILLILAYAIVNIVAKFFGSSGNVISP